MLEIVTTNTDEDWVSMPIDKLALEEIGHSELKDIGEIGDHRIRVDGDNTVHTMKPGDSSSLSITYSNRCEVLGAEPAGVRFERGGERIFVMKDSN